MLPQDLLMNCKERPGKNVSFFICLSPTVAWLLYKKKGLAIFLVKDGEINFKEITSRNNLLLCSSGHGLSIPLLYLFFFLVMTSRVFCSPVSQRYLKSAVCFSAFYLLWVVKEVRISQGKLVLSLFQCQHLSLCFWQCRV